MSSKTIAEFFTHNYHALETLNESTTSINMSARTASAEAGL